MYWDLPSVTISSLQRTTKPLLDNDVVCVFKQSEPAFYTVKPERMKQLIHAEMMLDKIKKEQDNIIKVMSDLPF